MCHAVGRRQSELWRDPPPPPRTVGPRQVLWVGRMESTAGTRIPPPRPIQGLGRVLPDSDHGHSGGSPSPRRRRDKRENRELFREGVEDRHTKIRPLVPKKTLAPTKALERGSSVRNVTPGRASAGLGGEVSVHDQWDGPMAGGHGHLSPSLPTCRMLGLVPAASHLAQAGGGGEGRALRSWLALCDLPGCVFPFWTVPLPPALSAAFWGRGAEGGWYMWAWGCARTGNSRPEAWGVSQ